MEQAFSLERAGIGEAKTERSNYSLMMQSIVTVGHWNLGP
jgi:hypothetical protein